jgi:hypothetical protein
VTAEETRIDVKLIDDDELEIAEETSPSFFLR